MTAHRHFIQSSKTELIVIGSRQRLPKVLVDKLRVAEVTISAVSVVRDLESWLDIHICLNIRIVKLKLQQGILKPLLY